MTQAEDPHPYALHTYLLEELNKLGLAYVHFIEPRASHSMGVDSPYAEFNFQRLDQHLDVSNFSLLFNPCIAKPYLALLMAKGCVEKDFRLSTRLLTALCAGEWLKGGQL